MITYVTLLDCVLIILHRFQDTAYWIYVTLIWPSKSPPGNKENGAKWALIYNFLCIVTHIYRLNMYGFPDIRKNSPVIGLTGWWPTYRNIRSQPPQKTTTHLAHPMQCLNEQYSRVVPPNVLQSNIAVRQPYWISFYVTPESSLVPDNIIV